MKKEFSSWFVLTLGVLFSVGFSALLAAQGTGPALVASVSDDGKPEPLRLAGLAVEVKIAGVVAETRMTMSFHNPSDRELAGDLYFPLPEGATVSGYALDINGVMVDGVVVEKEKGRRVFESLSRRRIDPGLVEWVKGNHFKARVFPIPARGGRTVMVRYLSELFSRNRARFYQLPLGFSARIKDFSLRMEVASGAVEPRVLSGGPGNLAFAKWRHRFVAETKLNDALLPSDLVVEVPDADAPGVVVEKTPEGEYYFLACVAVPQAAKAGPTAAGIPGRVTIFWDASGSRGRSDHRLEFELLKKYFAGLGRGTVAVSLVVFRNECEAPVAFRVLNGNADELLAMLARVGYDGGTATGCLAPAGEGGKPDLYLLFSDGIANFGTDEPARFDAPLYVFSGDGGADHPFLRHLAESNGGRYFNLVQVQAADAAREVGRSTLRFAGCEGVAGAVIDTYPRSAQSAGERLVLAGKLLAAEADFALDFRRGHEKAKNVRVHVSRDGAVAGELLRTFWAQKKIEELMIFSRRNDRELVETGKTFGLVTPGTSLIVLDNLEQYIEHRIAPPKTLPEMRRQYFERVEQEDSQRKRNEEDRLARIFGLWSARLQWWGTDFSKPAAPKKDPPASVQAAPASPASPAGTAPQANRHPVALRSDVTLDRGSHAAIQGKVVMEDDSPLPGVTVSLTGPRGAQTAVVSDEDGKFWYRRVPPGEYHISAELPGFRTVQYRNLRVPGAGTVPVTIRLPLASIQEQITVSAALAPVETRVAALAADREDEDEADEGGEEDEEESGVDGMALNAVTRRGRSSQPVIAIQTWDPKTPYIQALKDAGGGDHSAVYMEQRVRFGDSPGFYLDCADFFLARNKNAFGLRVLSNIAELGLEEPGLLRVLGHRLQQLGYLELSVWVFEEILKLRPEEPQSHRDLALVLAAQGQYERAVELLNHVVMNEWERFDEIELIALNELNNIVAKAKAAGIQEFKVSPRLLQPLELDIRIVMTWDADMTDIDLWVTEPTEEKAFYNHNLTSIGGLVSKDFTDGYGPEEYLIRKAKHGVYKIQADYFGSHSNRMLGPVTVQVDVFTDWGRPGEKKKSLTLRLAESKEVALVGEIEF